MQRRLLSLILILGCMGLIVYADPFGLPEALSPTLVLGFMLLAAYCIGYLFELKGLPRITGYIFAGLFLGPFFLNFYSNESVVQLSFLNNLALAFIAFCAGGELRLENLRKQLKSILYLISGVTIIVFFGVGLIVFSISELIPFMAGYSTGVKLAIAGIFGVIAVARSPSTTIAIISETKAEGDYTDIVLSVTIAKDVVVLVFFAVIISACEVLAKGESGFSAAFLLELLFEIAVAFILGFLLGKLIIFLIEKMKLEFPVVITAMGFLVIKFSHLLGDYLHQAHEINIQLEPLLICMAAGFTVQNFSKHGKTFLERMDNMSAPIYIAFFVITGASVDVTTLADAWLLGLLVTVIRLVTLYVGCYFSGRMAGDPPRIYKNSWMGLITQAGVSLGLLAEVVRRFPDFGPAVQTILIASITLNQIIGPIFFKYALHKVGEAGIKKPDESIEPETG